MDPDPYSEIFDDSPCYDDRDPIEWYFEDTSPCYDDYDPSELHFEDDSPPNLDELEDPNDVFFDDSLDPMHSTYEANASGHQMLKTENEMLKYQLETKTKSENFALQELIRMKQENEQLKTRLVQKKVSGCYPMKSVPCGIAVIINNEEFISSSKRVGTDKDAHGLEDLFTYLGFSLHRHDNLTGDKMMAALVKVADMNHSRFDSLVVAILTHGREGNVLYGTDNKTVAVRDVVNIFKADNCPSLAGKPKIIFLQACRGAMTDKGTTATSMADFMEDSLLDTGPKTIRRKDTIPTMADFLIVCSTFSGYVAYRDRNSGSYFVSALVDVVRREAKDEPLHDMITKVIEQVSSLSTSRGEKQVPQFKSSLRLKLYFNPVQ